MHFCPSGIVGICIHSNVKTDKIYYVSVCIHSLFAWKLLDQFSCNFHTYSPKLLSLKIQTKSITGTHTGSLWFFNYIYSCLLDIMCNIPSDSTNDRKGTPMYIKFLCEGEIIQYLLKQYYLCRITVKRLFISRHRGTVSHWYSDN